MKNWFIVFNLSKISWLSLICFFGVEEFDNPGPPYTKPKAYAEDEEMAEDEQRKPK